jgi:hypothetical protein
MYITQLQYATFFTLTILFFQFLYQGVPKGQNAVAQKVADYKSSKLSTFFSTKKIF